MQQGRHIAHKFESGWEVGVIKALSDASVAAERASRYDAGEATDRYYATTLPGQELFTRAETIAHCVNICAAENLKTWTIAFKKASEVMNNTWQVHIRDMMTKHSLKLKELEETVDAIETEKAYLNDRLQANHTLAVQSNIFEQDGLGVLACEAMSDVMSQDPLSYPQFFTAADEVAQWGPSIDARAGSSQAGSSQAGSSKTRRPDEPQKSSIPTTADTPHAAQGGSSKTRRPYGPRKISIATGESAGRKRQACPGPPEHDPGPATGESACRKRQKTTKECYGSPTPEASDMVINAVEHVDPFWPVTSFRFKTPDVAINFWREVCQDRRFASSALLETPQNPARKLLQSLGYRDVPKGFKRNNKEKWQSSTEWHWDMLAALSNCYWFSNKVQSADVWCCLALAFRDSPRTDMISPLVDMASQVFQDTRGRKDSA